MAAKALIVLGLAACAAASGESYQSIYRQDGYDRVPTTYDVRVNGYNAYVDDPKFGRLGKRSTYGYTPALAYHPAGGYGYNKYGPGYSYTYRSTQGLHKREAEPSQYSYSYGVDAYDGNQYVERYQNDGYGYGYHKREAEPSYAPALAYHPAGGYGYNKYGPGYSYTDRSPQGLHKREASGESYQYVNRYDGYDRVPTNYGVRVSGYNAYVDEDRVGRLGKRSTYGYTPAIAYHPAGGYGYNKYGAGTSYTYRSPQGLHKREAEPSYAPALAYHPAGGYGYNKYGPGYSYTDRSPQGLHKREASGSSYQQVERSDCYGYNCENTEYGVEVNGYNAKVDEARDGYNFAYNYGFNN